MELPGDRAMDPVDKAASLGRCGPLKDGSIVASSGGCGGRCLLLGLRAAMRLRRECCHKQPAMQSRQCNDSNTV